MLSGCVCWSTISPGSTLRHLLVIIDELWERHPLHLMKTHGQSVARELSGTYVDTAVTSVPVTDVCTKYQDIAFN